MKTPDINEIVLNGGVDAGRAFIDGATVWNAPWWRDPATIPARQFLFGRHYIRRAIGATIAAGGRGKTTLAGFEAVTMAAGRDLSSTLAKKLNGLAMVRGAKYGARQFLSCHGKAETVTKFPAVSVYPANAVSRALRKLAKVKLRTREPLPVPLRVWLLNGEEDQDELDRRVAAVCQHYGITKADLGGRLFAQSVRDHPLRIATMGKGGAPGIDDGVVNQMIQFIEQNRIDVFMIDPLISFHGVVENDNAHMDLVIKQGFGAVAGRTNSAGEVFHHPGKPRPGQAETAVEDGRGASAILWAVRSARVMNFMTPDEAEKLGMSDEERKLHIRIANGKANMAPLGKAKWIKIEVENLPNGDQVATASSWEPPDPFKNLTTADMELAVKLAATGEYRADRRSPQWFGYAVAEGMNLDVSHGGNNDPKDLAKLKTIINTWLKNKVFETEERRDSEGKPRKFIVSSSPRPSREPKRFFEGNEDCIT